ncbi:MAG: amino acid permease [Candidatus Bipolaricaulia bacterium]
MSDVREELSRDFSLFDITMIGVGAMIGAGIFVLTGIAAGAAGPALILAFALNGIVALMTAMAYAELGSAIPEAGGGYLWIKYGLPGPNAFLAGWMSWFAHAVAGSLYGLGFSSYVMLAMAELFGVHIGEGSAELVHKALAALIIALFLWINYRGASETGTIGNVITVLKVIILAVFIVSGIAAIGAEPANLQKFYDFAPFGWLGVVSAMGLTFIAFEGYEIIVQAGEEVKDPRRNIPKAVFLSLAIVIPVYMLVAFVSLGAVNPDTDVPTFRWLANHAELGVAEAARQFMPLGMSLLLGGGLVSTMSALNATTYSSTRVSFAMGRDENLPAAFAQVHERTRTPYKALLASGALILFMALAIPIEDVAAAADVMFLLLFLQVNVALLTLTRRLGDDLNYGYRVPFYPGLPIVAIGALLALAIFLFFFSPTAWYFTLAWIALGLLAYYGYARSRGKTEERTPVMDVTRRSAEPTEGRFHALVPIANPKTLPQLVGPAIEAARQHDGMVTLLHVVTVPSSLPLDAGRRFVERSQPLIDEAVALSERTDVPIEVVTRLSHRPAQAILDTAEEKNVDLLVMGWRGRNRTSRTLVGQNIDRIVERVNCDLLVVQESSEETPTSLLLPIEAPYEVETSLAMARLLSPAAGLRLTLLHVFAPRTPDDKRETRLQRIRDRVEAYRKAHPEFAGEIKVTEDVATDPVNAIAQAAQGQETILLGTPRRNWFRRRFVTSTPARVAGRVSQPVALVRPQGSAVGFGLHRLIARLRGEGDDAGEGGDEALEALEAHGLLQGDGATPIPPRTPAQRVGLLVMAVAAVASAVLMVVGYGRALTWVGAGGFILTLWAFTWRAVRTIDRAAARSD